MPRSTNIKKVRCEVACMTCRKSHLKCERSPLDITKCKRCIKRNRECVFEKVKVPDEIMAAFILVKIKHNWNSAQ